MRLVILVLCFTWSLILNAAEVTRSVSVQGFAEKSVQPDAFTLNFSFTERSVNLSQAKKQVDTKIASAVSTLMDLGVERKNIESMQISVYPWSERENGKTIQKGFVYSRKVNFNHDDLGAFDTIVDGISKLRPNNFGSVSLMVSDISEIKDALSIEALENARTKAQKMANSLDMEVVNVISITDSQSPINYRNEALPMLSARASDASSVSLPSEQKVQARIAVSFEIAKKLKVEDD